MAAHDGLRERCLWPAGTQGGSHRARAAVKRALDTVRLTALAQRYPSELSGGQQQQVALARALVVEPDILLLDEPLSNLDAHLREEMRYEIRQVHDLLGLTTVYVTHDQGKALVTADKIAVMQSGQVQQFDSPVNVFSRPANTFVASFIGTNNELHGQLAEPGPCGSGTGFCMATTAVRPVPAARLACAFGLRPSNWAPRPAPIR